MPNIFFTSDTHFNHKNIIDYCNRPFSSVEEMNEKLIENWNKTVKENDYVFHLGDFIMGDRNHLPYIVKKLNGFINLVPGNHDTKQSLKWFKEHNKHKLFDKNIIWRKNDYSFELTHNPYRAYQDHDYVLCGHIHTNWKVKKCGETIETYASHAHSDKEFVTKKLFLNVGVDVWNYTPVSCEEIISEITK